MSLRFQILDTTLDYDEKYDLRIFALGYESRSRHWLKTLRGQSSQSFAFAFEHDKVLAWDDNEAAFEKAGVELISVGDEEFYSVASKVMRDYSEGSESRRVFVDISSFSRLRLACLVESAAKHLPVGSTIIFGYSAAKFTPPGNDESPITKFAPVTSHFAGLPLSPELPLIAILGLGYDQGRALGAIEYLEIGKAWLFKPTGGDTPYSASLDKANEWLLKAADNNVFDYPVRAPVRTYSKLSSSVQSVLLDGRPLIIPFGPKIFALCSMLIAENLYPRIPVWHVTSSLDNPVDRKPDFCTAMTTKLVDEDAPG